MKPFDPWSDPECINLFCQLNSEDYIEWCTEKGILKTKYPDKELDFCEYRKSQFIEFGQRYYEGLLAEDADRFNDERKSED